MNRLMGGWLENSARNTTTYTSMILSGNRGDADLVIS